jgi:2-C-methyl-D-erythritol 4-phosphate cytidylyltransferase
MFYHGGKVYKIHALIAAAGSASRMGAAAADGVNKVYADLNGAAVILHSINKFAAAGFVDSVTAVIASGSKPVFNKAVKNANMPVNKITGGPTRSDSVYNGLKKIMEKADKEENPVVIIHDGARPNFRVSDLTAALKMLLSGDAEGSRPAGVVFASPSFDTLCRTDPDGMIEGYADRAKIYKIATPQIFDLNTIYGCFTKLEKINMSDAIIFSDESSLAVHFGCGVRIYKCPSDNIKITTGEDLDYLKSIMKAESGV